MNNKKVSSTPLLKIRWSNINFIGNKKMKIEKFYRCTGNDGVFLLPPYAHYKRIIVNMFKHILIVDIRLSKWIPEQLITLRAFKEGLKLRKAKNNC